MRTENEIATLDILPGINAPKIPKTQRILVESSRRGDPAGQREHLRYPVSSYFEHRVEGNERSYL